MEDNTNKKNIILGGLIVLALAGIGGIYYYNQANKAGQSFKETQKEVQQVPEFGDITDFVKKDLTQEQKDELKAILEQRKDRQVMMKEILDEAYNGNGDMEDAWIKVQEIREKCKNRILPYINENRTNDFMAYCDSLAEELDSNYVQK